MLLKAKSRKREDKRKPPPGLAVWASPHSSQPGLPIALRGHRSRPTSSESRGGKWCGTGSVVCLAKQLHKQQGLAFSRYFLTPVFSSLAAHTIPSLPGLPSCWTQSQLQTSPAAPLPRPRRHEGSPLKEALRREARAKPTGCTRVTS